MITKILICAALLGAILLAETCWPVGAAAAVVAVVAARLWRWPDAPAISYVTTWRVALPASAAAAGIELVAAATQGHAPLATLYFSAGAMACMATMLMLAGELTPRTISNGLSPRAAPIVLAAACWWLGLGLATLPLRQPAATVAPVTSRPVASQAQPLCYRHGLAYSLGWGDKNGRVCGTAAWPAVTAPSPIGSAPAAGTAALPKPAPLSTPAPPASPSTSGAVSAGSAK